MLETAPRRGVAIDNFVDRASDLPDEEAKSFFESAAAHARTSRNEREFQLKVDGLLAEFGRTIGVELLFRGEYTLATGRADAVYNRLVIEYEAPNSLRTNLAHSRTAHAVQQVKDYMSGLVHRERHARERLLGVAFDGVHIVFVRFRDDSWQVEPVAEWSIETAARLLRAVVALSSGRALIPNNLVEDFGARNLYSQQVTSALYRALQDHQDDLVAALFSQWKLFFSEVSGYDEASAQLKYKKELRSFAVGMGLDPDEVDPPRLFFALHTYFSFIAKMIARLVLERYAGPVSSSPPLSVLCDLESSRFREELKSLEDGGVFRALGFDNLLEGDFFSWYLDAWSDPVRDSLQLTVRRLSEYNPATIEEDPDAARDLLKKLYHFLMPRELRHDLGEYYTPDWLAERLLTQLGEPLFVAPTQERQKAFGKRLLDPACGSGTFLVLAIRAFKAHAQAAGLESWRALSLILENIVGIDLNPLAVLAARVSYLLAIADLVPHRRHPIVLPVYLADSIVAPSEARSLFNERRSLRTVVGDFPVPRSVDSRESITAVADSLYDAVERRLPSEAFLQMAEKRAGRHFDETDRATLDELFTLSASLKNEGRDGVWARILKNAFMPLFIGEFDYVVGNPPWVNWESLPDAYRQQTMALWSAANLFVHRGMDTILGKGKKDISTLMTYVVADRFLKLGGRLGFVITQSVFKASGAAEGFRAFRLHDGTNLRVVHVDDMSELQPFEGASNRTAVLILQKGQLTRYPVPYTFWRRTTRGRGLDFDSTLDQVRALTRRLQFSATPVSSNQPAGPWLTARRDAIRALERLLGPSDYSAHLGVNSGGANAVYWLEVIQSRPDGLAIVRNIVEGSKRPVEMVTTAVEESLLRPLLRPRDIRRWEARPSAHILMVQDPAKRVGISIAEMRENYPHTWAYLQRFEDNLRARSAYKRYFAGKRTGPSSAKEAAPFYSMFDVGMYTFAPYKVVWNRIAKDIAAAVVGANVVPQETISLIGVESQIEANYLAAALNSAPFRFAAMSYSQVGGKSFGSPHLLENLRVARFKPRDRTHELLAEYGLMASSGEVVADRDLDRLACNLWEIGERELSAIRRSLDELLTRPTAGASDAEFEPID